MRALGAAGGAGQNAKLTLQHVSHHLPSALEQKSPTGPPLTIQFMLQSQFVSAYRQAIRSTRRETSSSFLDRSDKTDNKALPDPHTRRETVDHFRSEIERLRFTTDIVSPSPAHGPQFVFCRIADFTSRTFSRLNFRRSRKPSRRWAGRSVLVVWHPRQAPGSSEEAALDRRQAGQTDYGDRATFQAVEAGQDLSGDSADDHSSQKSSLKQDITSRLGLRPPGPLAS